MDTSVWPLSELRLRCRDVTLRPVWEGELAQLAAIQPADFEHDPRAEMFPWLTLEQNRRRLVHQEYWQWLGAWSPSSWRLPLVVEYRGAVVGEQVLEGRNFPVLRTVSSGSWLVREVRGRGVGVSMRAVVLGLAFDHLGAVAAVSSARTDNAASLGVSRHLGYVDNGVSINDSGAGAVLLQHVRLTVEDWRASGHGRDVEAECVEPCLPWFGAAPPGGGA